MSSIQTTNKQHELISERHYNWRRYWCPRGALINFSEDGFLFSPGEYNPQILPFEKIAGTPVLVLLGEPGIGKTSAMKAERDLIGEAASREGDEVLLRDLRPYGTPEQVIAKIFGHRKFQAWVAGTHRLHLLLDSFDECRLEVKQLASVIAEELRDYEDARERLILRIACRTADWSGLLESALREIWGDDAVKVYELAPLTQDDVRVAAADEGIDPEQFLTDVHYREVGPLAAKPLTLRLLLNLYGHEGGRLPLTQAELYAKGCGLLARETSPSYLEAGHVGKLNAARRMTVAGRIAAVTVICQKDAVWTAADFGDVPEGDIRIEELVGGTELAGGEPFEVDAAAVEEVIHTGLFTSRGINRLGWAHQTYAEFLAAWHLSQLEVTTEQALELVVHPEDPEGKLVPQLHETAAWLAGMRPDVFQKIIEHEPKVLLQSDVASAAPESRAALTEELLKLYEEEREFDNDWFIGVRYRKLCHPGVADQLRPYVKGSGRGFMARRMALEMAGACKARELQSELADVALNASETIDLRQSAAHAVAEAGDAEAKARLKDLAEDRAGEDPGHGLKGIALEALWPGQLSGEELFPLLVEPGIDVSTLYGSFLAHGVGKHLKPEDLPTALRWADEQGPYHYLNYYSSLLVSEIMLLAWQNLYTPGVLDAFARSVLLRLQRHDSIVKERISGDKFSEVLTADDEKRRLLLGALVPLITDPEKAGFLLMNMGTTMARSKDVPWLLARLLREGDEGRQLVWASVIKSCWNYGDPDQLDLLFLTSLINPAMAYTFRWDFRAIPIDSKEAEDARKREALRRQEDEEEEAQETRAPLDPPPAARVAGFLDAGEEGDGDAWWNLNIWLRAEEDGTAGVSEEEPNLKVYPGWLNANPATRRRIGEAGKRYLLERDAQPEAWIDGNDIFRPACSGYRALRLLLDEDPAFVSGLGPEVWKKWAPIILAYQMPYEVGEEEKGAQRRLVEMAYRHAPDEIIGTLMKGFERSNKENGSVTVPDALESCWDARLQEAILAKAGEPGTKSSSLYSLLRALEAHGAAGASAIAESFITTPLPSQEEERRKAMLAALFLVENYPDTSWAVIRQVVESDVDFGRELVGKIAYAPLAPRGKGLRLAEHLGDSDLADLYVWVVQHFPYEEDPDAKGFHQISTREMVARWRDSLLDNLRGRGTQESCAALARVADTFPELKLIRRFLLESRALLRRRTWRPPAPSEIIILSAKQQEHLSLKEGRRRIDELLRALWILECALDGDEEYGDTCGQGTAFMLSGVGLVTCQHVLCPHLKAFRPDAPDKKHEVKVVVNDVPTDLAVLRLVGVSESAELEARWSPPLERKERITVAGFPNYGRGSSVYVRGGEVVGFRTEVGVHVALVDVPIISGNSGGPVLDGRNQVVGVAAKGVSRIEEAHTTEKHAVIPVIELRRLLDKVTAR